MDMRTGREVAPQPPRQVDFSVEKRWPLGEKAAMETVAHLEQAEAAGAKLAAA
jgi:hypothetical protein